MRRQKFHAGRILKLLVKLAGLAFISLILLLVTCTWVIDKKTEPYLYQRISDVKPMKVGLVLGTSKYLGWERLNPFFEYRIEAAVALFKAGKIKYIIVSGDNHRAGYNEPDMMRKTLIHRGIPPERIYMDFAGFRTFDSMVRCHEIFGQSSFIVISQKFHNQRAVYIGRAMGLNVYGFDATDVELSQSFKTLIREYFARVKVFIDIYSGTQPKFLGKKIQVGNAADQ